MLCFVTVLVFLTFYIFPSRFPPQAAISLIPDVPAQEEIEGKRVHTEDRLASFLKSLLSTLVLAPGHPDHGPFYIVQGLLNAIPKYPWQAHTGVQTRVYIDMLALLCTYSQRTFPYHVALVESNDSLYGGAPGYMFELRQATRSCLQEILRQLTLLGGRDAAGRTAQARVGLDLVNQLAVRAVPSAALWSFCGQLMGLCGAAKGSFTRADALYMRNTCDMLRGRCDDAGLLAVLRGL